MGLFTQTLKTEASHNNLSDQSKLEITDKSTNTIYNFITHHRRTVLCVILGIVIVLAVPLTIELMSNKPNNEEVSSYLPYHTVPLANIYH